MFFGDACHDASNKLNGLKSWETVIIEGHWQE